MEGANAYKASISRTFQRYKILDDRRNICVGFELLNDFVRVERHVYKIEKDAPFL